MPRHVARTTSLLLLSFLINMPGTMTGRLDRHDKTTIHLTLKAPKSALLQNLSPEQLVFQGMCFLLRMAFERGARRE